MKIIYIAGPYAAPTLKGIDENIARAREVAGAVARLGAVPLTPHLNSAHMDHIQDLAWWLAAALELLHVCDAVRMVPGWQRSEGAKAEREEAAASGIPVFYDVEALRRWLGEEGA